MDSFRHCEALTRAADKDRFLSALFAPAAPRDGLFALCAFNIEVARVSETVREPMAGEIRLQWWRDVLTNTARGEVTANPVAAALLETIARWHLPPQPLLDLIDARSFDLYDDLMPSIAALEAYGRRTSSALITLASRILCGEHPAVAKAADAAGIAFALTGLMRVIARRASEGRLFIPSDVLARDGALAEDVLAGRTTDALRAALASLRNLARLHLAQFEELLPTLPPAAGPAFLPVALVPGYLDQMERRDYDPFRTVVDVPQWRRQWVLWRAARRYARTMRG
jgi:15-cis-phytoene synthase